MYLAKVYVNFRLQLYMTPLFILRFWLGVQGEHCKNGPCSEFCRCTFQKCWTNSYIDYVRPSSLINVLIEITVASYPLVVPLCHSLYISIVSRNHICLSKSAISAMFFKKAVNEAEWTVLLPDKALLIARCSSGKDLLHGAEKKAMLLGQLYVGPNSLWAPFVTVIVQWMYCLVLCCGVALLACIPLYLCFAPPRLTC